MTSGEAIDSMDLHAAFIRRAAADQGAFVEALAARLEQALPGLVRIERKRNGLFSKAAHVRTISIDAGDTQYVLEQDQGMLRAMCTHVAQGVILKRETLYDIKKSCSTRCAPSASAESLPRVLPNASRNC